MRVASWIHAENLKYIRLSQSLVRVARHDCIRSSVMAGSWSPYCMANSSSSLKIQWLYVPITPEVLLISNNLCIYGAKTLLKRYLLCIEHSSSLFIETILCDRHRQCTLLQIRNVDLQISHGRFWRLVSQDFGYYRKHSSISKQKPRKWMPHGVWAMAFVAVIYSRFGNNSCHATTDGLFCRFCIRGASGQENRIAVGLRTSIFKIVNNGIANISKQR